VDLLYLACQADLMWGTKKEKERKRGNDQVVAKTFLWTILEQDDSMRQLTDDCMVQENQKS
jgi:hypothetical protein